MSIEQKSTLERVGQEIVDVFAEGLVVLNDIGADGDHGGGDVDCAARGVRPYWHLRLSDWRVCQTLWYDVSARYLVFVRGDEALALDVLDDPSAIGKYGFRTDLLTFAEGAGGYAAPPDRAAYLTLKRIVKGIRTTREWGEIAGLASVSRSRYRVLVAGAVGEGLARTIDDELDAEHILSDATFEAARSRLYARRRFTPERMRLSVARLSHRLAHPTGLVVQLVGPDGAGKSSVADALPAACGQLFRRSARIHFRPGVLPRPGAIVRRPDVVDASDPHAREPHGRLVSIALLGYHWLDALAGFVVRVLPIRARSGLVVVERGFADIAVDPRRYRLRVSSTHARKLARLLPQADLTLILEADPDVIAARKSELGAAEVRRQLDAWRLHAPTAVRIDVSRPLAEVVPDARAAIANALEHRVASTLDGGWAAVPSVDSTRLWIPRRRKPARGALRAQTAGKAGTRVAQRAAGLAAAAGFTRLLPSTAPPAAVRRALAAHLPSGCTYSVKSAIHPGRYHAVLLESTGRRVALAKIATNDATRTRLQAERAAIERLSPLLPRSVAAPRIVGFDDDVLVVEWVEHRNRPRPWLLPAEVAGALGRFFAAGGDGARGPAHGDCAPWNLLATEAGWTLVDWEVSLDDAPAFFDPFHYIVQSHAFLGRPRRAEILRGLEGRGWIGDALAAYAASAGVPRESAPRWFAEYLRHTMSPETRRDMGEWSLEVRRALLASVA